MIKITICLAIWQTKVALFQLNKSNLIKLFLFIKENSLINIDLSLDDCVAYIPLDMKAAF
ncbi:hypothetical protein BpHYR1_002725 [Brachionus plicatilis]|uniref:Uncharacterized protein n=1 Tax=Brachionus plicatilis TaxID=10195 RepID=A0A3M7QAK4_BRAPC|nr:hypothetical protein BpHYR1_002725 [Brachionus plicatilis]